MRISIIIPALNEAALIGTSIERALATSPHEVIVVDGGSVDETAMIAERFDCHVAASPPGRARQQNCGARIATGDVLLFLHADCWLVPHALGQIKEALKVIDVGAGAFRQRIDGTGIMYRCLENGNALRVKALKMAYGDQGIFVRRRLFEELGGFPEVSLMEDVLVMRKLRRRTRIVLLDGPLTVSARRWEKHGVIRQTARNWLILSAQRFGMSPDRLSKLYQSHWQESQNR